VRKGNGINGATSLTNSGTITASDVAALDIQETVTNSGSLVSTGGVAIATSSYSPALLVDNKAGGTIAGNGTAIRLSGSGDQCRGHRGDGRSGVYALFWPILCKWPLCRGRWHADGRPAVRLGERCDRGNGIGPGCVGQDRCRQRGPLSWTRTLAHRQHHPASGASRRFPARVRERPWAGHRADHYRRQHGIGRHHAGR
jgi:hypothetical protein